VRSSPTKSDEDGTRKLESKLRRAKERETGSRMEFRMLLGSALESPRGSGKHANTFGKHTRIRLDLPVSRKVEVLNLLCFWETYVYLFGSMLESD
jgi:hypothetical protein